MYFITAISLFFYSLFVYANPYWDPNKVPRDGSYLSRAPVILKTVSKEEKIYVLRVQVNWAEEGERYTINHMVLEQSGTPALLARSPHQPKWGSYLGLLKDSKTGKTLYFDSVGTGKEYRKLARAINLRFPLPENNVVFELYAENPQTGVMEKVVEQPIIVSKLEYDQAHFPSLEVKELALAKTNPSLRVNIYAEGYSLKEKNKFWQQALKTVDALYKAKFPGVEYMSFYAVFSPSTEKLGKAKNLSYPVPEFNSFLGLYYPYWDNFGRWYHIVYPTRENKFRQALASAPYDYPIVLVNNAEYWGVGNYMSHTAIPAENSIYFTYLLLHEMGHFFGLNEEYEGGGRTELEFAPDIEEPWSQNISFLANPSYSVLKWNQFVQFDTELPTPYNVWHSSPPVYGAYQGGYGDSQNTKGVSHKPGLNCIMESHENFCAICAKGILDVVQFSLGIN